MEFEEYYKIMVEGSAKIPILDIPIDTSYKKASEFKSRLKQYYEENKETKYEWTGFIKSARLLYFALFGVRVIPSSPFPPLRERANVLCRFPLWLLLPL